MRIADEAVQPFQAEFAHPQRRPFAARQRIKRRPHAYAYAPALAAMGDGAGERLPQRRPDTDEHKTRFLRHGEVRRCEECVRIVLEACGGAMPAHVLEPVATLQLGYRLGVAAYDG